jgi:uncharacterized membrane protein
MENLADYLNLRHKPENINKKHRSKLGFQDRIALLITGAVGTMYAVYIFALSIAGWMIWQTYIDKRPFDPFPFVFLLFLGNIVQLLLMPLIMVGQNLQGKHDQLRADEEFKTTESSYRDIEQILVHLGDQDKQMQKQLEILLDLANKKR